MKSVPESGPKILEVFNHFPFYPYYLFILNLTSYLADVILCQVLYVMELRQDLEKGKASFTAVSEFLLTHPVLSFGVRDVTHSRLRHTEVLPAEEESESMTTGAHVHSLTQKNQNSFHSCSLLIFPVTT